MKLLNLLKKLWAAKKAQTELKKLAKAHGFPVLLKHEYLYACYCAAMGNAKRTRKWREFLELIGFDDKKLFELYPCRRDGDLVASYEVVQGTQEHSSGSDFAFGDRGVWADLRLVRIDEIQGISSL